MSTRDRTPSTDQWSVARLLAVGLGAAAGALLRVLVGQRFPVSSHELPTGTLVVNVTGCLLMGLLTPPLRRAGPLVSVALITGLLGGYTTFSAFSLDVLGLADAAPLTVLLYVGLTLVGCIGATTVGLLAAARLVSRPDDEEAR